MEIEDVLKKIAKIQSNAFESALKAKLNEGYTIDELEIEYETNTVRKGDGISTTVKTIIKKKADDQ